MKKAMFKVPYSYDLVTFNHGYQQNVFQTHPREWLGNKLGFYRLPFDSRAYQHPRMELYQNASNESQLFIERCGREINIFITHYKMYLDVYSLAYLLLEDDILDVQEVKFIKNLNSKSGTFAKISGLELSKFSPPKIREIFSNCEKKDF